MNIRDFLNGVLAFLGAASLSDEEFDSLSIESAAYDVDTYGALLVVIDAREMVSGLRDRLRYLFLAKGVDVSASTPSKSNVLVGSVLCE